MTARHRCPAPHCDVQVPNHMYACRKDWFRLPNRLRKAIWKTADWPFGDERALAETECLEYWEANPPGR